MFPRLSYNVFRLNRAWVLAQQYNDSLSEDKIFPQRKMQKTLNSCFHQCPFLVPELLQAFQGQIRFLNPPFWGFHLNALFMFPASEGAVPPVPSLEGHWMHFSSSHEPKSFHALLSPWFPCRSQKWDTAVYQEVTLLGSAYKA